jgi:hypothetical protein
MKIDDLFSLMEKAAAAQEAHLAAGGKMGFTLNPTAHAWALEMERQGLMKRREDGMFDSERMFELWKEKGGFNG